MSTMRTLIVVAGVLSVCLCVHATVGAIGERMAEVTELCCTRGLAYARNHTSKDCSSSVPPDVSLQFSYLCQLAMDGCCKEYFEKKRDCEDGVEFAAKNQCSNTKSQTFDTCCQECERGKEDGARDPSACRSSVSSEKTEDELSSDAYLKCCKEAAGSNPAEAEDHRVIALSRTNTEVSSICEDYAPNELCAHHCIPVPGSYRCECNPGFMLMPDRRNCKEVQKNRCKPRNPCQHKCNDNGREVKCSCRRGYELQSDGKSCKDIDECSLNPPVCLPNTQCHNTQGSYKCIPVKKNSSEKGQCPAGFSRNLKNNVCDDVDECALPRPPCPRYSCENTVGAYKCGGKAGDPASFTSQVTPAPPQEDRCPPGFKSGFDEECEDVDECAEKKDDCNSLSQFCINTRGSFYCQDKVSKHCAPGFKINSVTKMCEDIDECLDSQSLCRKDQVCINVPGAYDCKLKDGITRLIRKCQEGFRLQPSEDNCEDIDECMEGTHLCDQYQNCLNTNGSHECNCKLGFELDVATGACVDVNECATDQNTCIPESQRCDNTVGSYLCIRFASCGTGYILHHSTSECEDIDECAIGIHNCGRAGADYQCVNMPGSFRCVRKVSSTTSTTASPEYEYEYYDSEEDTGNGDKTPKQTPSENKIENATATTTTPKPETATEPKYIPPENKTEENPYNERPVEHPNEVTEDNNVDFDLDARPTYNEPISPDEPVKPYNYPNSNGVYEKTSTSRPETDVSDVLIDNPKEDTATVKGTNRGDGSILVDTQDIPKNKWTKISQDNSFNNCQIGFEMVEYGICADINECATGKHICSSQTETCRNTIGGYVCDCATGFRRDLITKACDLIPSTTSTPTTPQPTVPPTSVEVPVQPEPSVEEPESPEIPKTPFQQPESPEESKPPMEPPVQIAPVPPSEKPTQPPTQITVHTSTEKNRPIEWTDWGYPYYKNPQRPFPRRNRCDVGFHWNSKINECEDIDECINGIASCAAIEECVNTYGGYRCECPRNWKLDEVRHQCVPMRKSGSFPSGYGNVPSRPSKDSDEKVVMIGNKNGQQGHKFVDPTITELGNRGEVLKCPWGYFLGDDNRCVDIDECSIGTSDCGPTQICTNLRGGYTCSCPSGHRLVGENCEDVNECSVAGNSSACSTHADCMNTVGSYQCRCHEGFRSSPTNDKVCLDVDECTETHSSKLCQHRCNNVWGGYRCSCYRGYRINNDNRTCSDIDECTEFASKRLCIGRCVNEPGSYRCTCPQGYRLAEDKRSCVDIDECEIGEAPCAGRSPQNGVSEVCLNTRGGYHCNRITCPLGYKLENHHRCTKIDKTCHASDWDCIHQPSTYSYNYITFVSKLFIPNSRVDLFTMRGPSWANSKVKFQLRMVDVDAPPSVRKKADISAFTLIPTRSQAVVSLVKSLDGPQSIQLELSMELYTADTFGGIAIAKIFIYVSEYEF